MVRIENWGVVGSADPYQAPELKRLKLHGAVYGHPTQEEGKIVSTSRILDADGLVVTCESRKYLLGQVSPDYLKALDEIGYKFDPENPIKVHKKESE